jgi:REP element-mobilizing transposase RayT
VKAWTEANAWLVGAYVIMPDHIHLFCAPKNEEITIEQWIVFWKRQFRRRCGPTALRFQSRGFHHRLGAMKTIIENGNMSEPILCEQGWLAMLKSGTIRAF